MVTLIDTSVLIAAERGELDLDSIIGKHAAQGFALSAITASELLHGVHRAAKPQQRAPREAFVEQLLSVIPTIPFDLVAARIHARIWAQLAAKGVAVNAHDLIIAATAIAIGASIATRDRRSFPKIPGVTVVEW